MRSAPITKGTPWFFAIVLSLSRVSNGQVPSDPLSPAQRVAPPHTETQEVDSSKRSRLFRIQEGDKYGYIDATGKVVVSPQFDWATDSFHDGLAWVELGKQFGFIDTTGKVVIAPQFDPFDSCSGDPYWAFSEGLINVRKGKKWGYSDKTGTMVIPAQFDCAGSFSEGLACVRKGKKRGYIDRSGNVAIPFQFDIAHRFLDGLAKIGTRDSYGPLAFGFIDRKGAVVIPVRYSVFEFSEGLARVWQGGKGGFMDQAAQIVIPPRFEAAGRFARGLAHVQIDGKWGFIDRTGTFVVPAEFESIRLDDTTQLLPEGSPEAFVAVSIAKRWGYIDRAGVFVIPLQFDNAFVFTEGLAAVSVGGTEGQRGEEAPKVYTRPNGNIVFEFSKPDKRHDSGSRWGFIDRTGKFVIPPQFQEALGFRDGLARVGLGGGHWGYIDKSGKVVWSSKGVAGETP